MLLNDIAPSIDLRKYIRKYRIAEFKFPSGQPVPFKAYPPRPQDCLHFYPKDAETVQYSENPLIYAGKKSVLTGQHTIVTNRFPGKDFLVFQVVFQPGILYRITGIPARELMNAYLDAEDILGTEIRLINEQPLQAKSYLAMVEIVEVYIRRLIRQQKKEAHSVEKMSSIMIANSNKSLEWFSDQACLGYRQFDRMFKERIGINPKLYMRIIRFDIALRMKNQYPERDWLSIAVYCGYHDYQHLVRDYKEFTGYTPAEFFAIENQAPERFFGDIDT